jgi:hypothetical protein
MARRRFFRRSKSEAIPQPTPETAGGALPAKPRQRKQEQATWYNRLALILLLLTPVVFVCYLMIFMIPTLPLNPFPPYAQALATFAPTPTPWPTYTRTPADKYQYADEHAASHLDTDIHGDAASCA